MVVSSEYCMFRKIRQRIYKTCRAQEGQILIIALIFFALGSLLLPILLSFAGSALKQGSALEARTRQQYMADAGAQQAIWWILDANHTSDPLPTSSGNFKDIGFVSEADLGVGYNSYVSFVSLTNNVTIYGITSYGGPAVDDAGGPNAAQTAPYFKIYAQVPVSQATIGVFDNAITALNGNINLTSSVTVNSTPESHAGSIAANGNISGSSSCYVDGNATVSIGHTITMSSGSSVSGTDNTLPSLNFAAITTSVYKTQAQAGQSAQSGTKVSNFSNGQTINNANTDYTTSLSLNSSQSLTFNGNLYVNGNLSINSSSHLTITGNVYVTGYVYINSSSSLTINNGVLYTGSYLTSNSSCNLSLGGTTYINGVLTLNSSNNLEAPYTIVAHNDVNLNSSINYTNAASTPLIISETGNMNLASSVNVGGFLYAPNGSVTLNSSVKVTGAVVGKAVSATSSVTVTRITSGRSGLPGGDVASSFGVITWDITNN